ncbi:MAG: response regulator [Janthinobacterium lividum]
MIGNPVTILLVEDDKVDVMAIRRSFLRLKIANPIIEAQDGIEALARLRGTDGYDPIDRPCLILLDLNMPRMGGLEFLAELRSDPVLQRSIVFVLTTSRAEEDRLHAYDKNVSGYVLKYRPGETFLDAISMLESYWRVIEFPD